MSSSSSSSTTDGGATLPERIEVGRIGRPHGIRGELTIESTTDVPGRFEPGARLWAVLPGGERRAVVISELRESGPGWYVARLAGVADRSAAERLRGARFEVERSEVPPAPEGSWWQFELVGCRAFDELRGELGTVVELVDLGGGPLLMVAMDDGRELALPFVERFLIRVDPAARRIDWRLPEGLIDACASRS